MSDMYGFGADEEVAVEPQNQDSQGPKWFREHMGKVSKQLEALQERNAQLEQVQRQQEVTAALTAKGYAPTAAQLFTGTPDKLDDWLGTYGAALAKTGGEAAEQGQESVQNTQTVVSPESQAAMQAMAAAGQDGVAALSSDDQQAARIRMAKDDSELNTILRESGSKYV